EGKRRVQVGYVVEAPIWKTSYRLVLADKEKPYLQGWAMVENPTDEDWSGVKMALVSGRPISFKMDLYNPLYINRPTVEPELFASLRPVTYQGGFDKSDKDEQGHARMREDVRRLEESLSGLRPRNQLYKTPTDGAGFGYAGQSVKPNDPNAAFAKNTAAELAQRMGSGSVGNAATAGTLGDFFQYTIDHPVTLPRQK